METVKSKLIEIWEQQIPARFKSGLITYERQLQAEFYYHLRKDLPEGYHIWIEPVITVSLSESSSQSYKIIPDMVITCEKGIVAVVEMKFKPWEYVAYKDDLDKLACLQKLAGRNSEGFTFGYIPVCSNWQVQKGSPERNTYQLADNHLSVYIAFAHPDSDVFGLKDNMNELTHFLFLHGHIPKHKHPENSNHSRFEYLYWQKSKTDQGLLDIIPSRATDPISIPVS